MKSNTGIIEAALEWLEQNKGCGWECRKCNVILGRKFQSLDSDKRQEIVDALCAADFCTLQTKQPLLWLVGLLNESERERFVRHITEQGPFDEERAWQVIYLSSGNQGAWRFNLDSIKGSFKFHLHPAIVPLLLQACAPCHSEFADLIRLLDYLSPVAHDYPILAEALPQWRLEQERIAKEREAAQQRESERIRVEAVRLAKELLAQEAHLAAIEKHGAQAIMRAIEASTFLGAWDCPDKWTRMSDCDLRALPEDLLIRVAKKIEQEKPSRLWRRFYNRISHLSRSRLHNAQRRSWLAELGQFMLPERLRIICDSTCSLDFFPDKWASEILEKPALLSSTVREKLFQKLCRFRRRSPWRDVKRLLMPQNMGD